MLVVGKMSVDIENAANTPTSNMSIAMHSHGVGAPEREANYPHRNRRVWGLGSRVWGTATAGFRVPRFGTCALTRLKGWGLTPVRSRGREAFAGLRERAGSRSAHSPVFARRWPRSALPPRDREPWRPPRHSEC